MPHYSLVAHSSLYTWTVVNMTAAKFKSLAFPVSGSPMFEVTLRLTVSQSVCLGIEYLCGTCDQILLPVGMLLSVICEVGVTSRLTDSQSVSMSWYRAPLWDLWPDITSCRNVVCNLRSRSYFTTDGRSVSQYVLVLNTLVGLVIRYYFLSECCCLQFAVLVWIFILLNRTQ
jgi:hypothetical protein